MCLQASTLSWTKLRSAIMDKMECAKGIWIPLCVCVVVYKQGGGGGWWNWVDQRKVSTCLWVVKICICKLQMLFCSLLLTRWLLYIFSNPQCEAGKEGTTFTLPMRKLKIRLMCACSLVNAKLPQSCLTLCDPMNCSLSGSSVHRILQEKNTSGSPCPSPGDLHNPRIEPGAVLSPALAGRFLFLFFFF